MSGTKGLPTLIPFGPFEADLSSQELRKHGVRLRLPRQSFQILKMLLERPGDLVTREELRQALWHSETFVDFEHGLNAAINRLREALGDSADNPEFIETLPRRGYRFIGPVNGKPRANHVRAALAPWRTFLHRKNSVLVTASILVLMVVIGIWWHKSHPIPATPVNSLSIAVLPFADLSPNHDQEYLSDGLAEEILNDLANVPGLKVVGRVSAFQFKGKSGDLRVIGKKLNVASVLEGSVRKDGSHIRVTAQLIKTEDGYHLWSEAYDRDVKDVIAIQEDIASAVTSGLQLKLRARESPAVHQSPGTSNPEAFVAFLQARYFLRMHDRDSSQRALDLANASIGLDPTYAPAYALRSGILIRAGGMVWRDFTDSVREGRRDAEQAIALAPKLPDGYRAMSEVQANSEANCPAAEVSINKARELAPGDPDTLDYAALLAMCQGRQEEALTLYQRELALDPLRPQQYFHMAENLRDLGRYDEANAALQSALELNPREIWQIHETRGEILLAQGRPQEALAEMEREPAGFSHELGMALAYHALGQHKDSDAALANLTSLWPNDCAYQIAQVYAYRGQVDEAFRWLEHAYRLHDPGLMWFRTDLKLKSLRGDPRYADLLRRLHLAQ
jgi:TolB-like protein/DNA-binding winged helix-turn-helix (wHTH) protein/Flp pilus assembly protein TadD